MGWKGQRVKASIEPRLKAEVSGGPIAAHAYVKS